MKRSHTTAFVDDKKELGQGAWLRRFRYDGEAVDARAFDALWALHPVERGEVMMYGKPIKTPRWHQTYGEKGYRFSGKEHDAVPLPVELEKFMVHANTVCAPYMPEGRQFNMMLMNWYQDGAHYIGYHSDDEKQLFHDAQGGTLVYSLTFGATRDFLLKPTEEKRAKQIERVALRHGDGLLMGGLCQRTHKHSVPKLTGKNATAVGRRINMTFRVFK